MQNGKVCLKCGKTKADSAFYKSSSSYHNDGLVPICRKCIIDTVYDPDTDDMDTDSFIEILRQVDKPFLPEIMIATSKQILKQYSNKRGYDRIKTVVGLYFKNINSLKQYQDTTFSSKNNKSSKGQNANDLIYYLADNSFVVTEDMIKLFGEGYTATEYKQMQNVYKSILQDYPNLANAQIRLLLRYVRYNAKEYTAMLQNDSDVDRWSRLANNALAQFTNSFAKNNSDDGFIELMQKVEQVENMKDILPKFEYRPNDAPDFIIWCYVNYCRRLEGKPEVDFEKIADYYDQAKSDFIQQYGDPNGMFVDDPVLKNRDSIREYITLPPEYCADNWERDET